jgi:hypothetical protein
MLLVIIGHIFFRNKIAPLKKSPGKVIGMRNTNGAAVKFKRIAQLQRTQSAATTANQLPQKPTPPKPETPRVIQINDDESPKTEDSPKRLKTKKEKKAERAQKAIRNGASKVTLTPLKSQSLPQLPDEPFSPPKTFDTTGIKLTLKKQFEFSSEPMERSASSDAIGFSSSMGSEANLSHGTPSFEETGSSLKTEGLTHFQIAKFNLSRHALFLLGFDFKQMSLDIASTHQEQIYHLAYLFHFHRYFISRLTLSNAYSQQNIEAMNIRNAIVHTADTTIFNQNTLLETQGALQKFLVEEVNTLLKSFRQHPLNDEDINSKLKHYSQNFKPGESPSMESVALFNLFYSKVSSITKHQIAKKKTSPVLINQWLRDDIIPFFAHCQTLLTNPESKHFIGTIVFNPLLDALKMLIIVTGDYCFDYESNKLIIDANVQTQTPEIFNRSQFRSFLSFLKKLRDLRNQLSHHVENVLDSEIVNLTQRAQSIFTLPEFKSETTLPLSPPDREKIPTRCSPARVSSVTSPRRCG